MAGKVSRDRIRIKMAGVGNENPEELDIYEDLIENDDFEATDFIAEKLNNVESLKSENGDLKAKLAELESRVEVSKRQNDILKRNISTLYKTAKLEISRKDLLLSDLQRRYDQLLFRRSKKPAEGTPSSSGTSFRNQNAVDIREQKENANQPEVSSNEDGNARSNRLGFKAPNVLNNNTRNRETLKREVGMDAKTCNDILGNINDAEKIYKMVQNVSKDKSKKTVNGDSNRLDSKDEKCAFGSNDAVESRELKSSALNSETFVKNEVLKNARELNVRDNKPKEHKLSENRERLRTADFKHKEVDHADRRREACDSKHKDLPDRSSTKSSKPMSHFDEVRRKDFEDRKQFSAKKRSRSPSKPRLSSRCERGSRERISDREDRTRPRHSQPMRSNNNSESRTRGRRSSDRSSNAEHSQKRRK